MTGPENDAAVTFQSPSAKELVVERVFRAPRERVFAAWATPEHLARWWGPRGFENDIREMDVRPGGSWHIVQRGPDGRTHPFRGVYLEVSPPERIVFTQRYDGAPVADPDLRVAVEFTTAGEDATRVRISMRFATAEDREEQVRRGMPSGMRESLERLAEVIEEDPEPA